MNMEVGRWVKDLQIDLTPSTLIPKDLNREVEKANRCISLSQDKYWLSFWQTLPRLSKYFQRIWFTFLPSPDYSTTNYSLVKRDKTK
jgi:hypothetical protein